MGLCMMTLDQAVAKAMTQIRHILEDKERERITDVLAHPRVLSGAWDIDLEQLDREVERGRAIEADWLADVEAQVRAAAQAWLDESAR